MNLGSGHADQIHKSLNCSFDIDDHQPPTACAINCKRGPVIMRPAGPAAKGSISIETWIASIRYRLRHSKSRSQTCLWAACIYTPASQHVLRRQSTSTPECLLCLNSTARGLNPTSRSHPVFVLSTG